MCHFLARFTALTQASPSRMGNGQWLLSRGLRQSREMSCRVFVPHPKEAQFILPALLKLEHRPSGRYPEAADRKSWELHNMTTFTQKYRSTNIVVMLISNEN